MGERPKVSGEPDALSRKEIGRRIEQLRSSKGWTQDHLALKAKISKSFISDVENGATIPGGKALLHLAEVFGTTTDYLLKGSSPSAEMTQETVIPPDLAQLAAEKGWSFRATEALARTRDMVLARRARSGAREWKREDWEQLFEKLREYIEPS